MADLTPITDSARPNSRKSLREHLEDMQHAVYVAESLISVIIACGASPKRMALVVKAAEDAQEVLDELGRGLDRVELDRMVSQ